MINVKKMFFVTLLLACFFVVEDFNAQNINRFNANKKRTGVWKKYYPNKRIRYEGKFDDGKEIGVFKFYSIVSSKHPTVIKTFSKTSDSVFVKFYNLNGKLEGKGILKGKKRVGIWQFYFPKGRVMSEENYKNGQLDGPFLIYYPNGKITESSMYKNGLKHGVSKKYSSKGILIEEVEYLNGKENGIAKYFELNGNLKETGRYKDGKRIGKWEYYLDGEIATEKEKKANRTSFKKKNKK